MQQLQCFLAADLCLVWLGLLLWKEIDSRRGTVLPEEEKGGRRRQEKGRIETKEGSQVLRRRMDLISTVRFLFPCPTLGCNEATGPLEREGGA